MDLLREKLRARGAHRLGCSSSPDMTAANEAAKSSAELGNKAFEWYKQKYEEQAPLRAKTAETEQKASDAQLAAMDAQTRIANETDLYNKTTFRPLEKSIVQDAEQFNTDDERNRLAGLATGDVRQGFSTARAVAGRTMARMGINPDDGRYAATIQRQSANDEALASANAGTTSRMNAITLGRAMKLDAASLGRGLPSQQATATQLALSAGSSGAQTGAMPLTQAQQAAGQVGAGYDQATRGYSTAGNIYGGIANTEAGVNNSNNATAGSAGAAVGTIAVMI